MAFKSRLLLPGHFAIESMQTTIRLPLEGISQRIAVPWIENIRPAVLSSCFLGFAKAFLLRQVYPFLNS